jgi:hypothetical protein
MSNTLILTVRWLMFFTVGFVTNALIAVLLVAYSLYFRLFVARKVANPLNISPTNEERLTEILTAPELYREAGVVDSDDTHGLLLHVGAAREARSIFALVSSRVYVGGGDDITLFRYPYYREGGASRHKETPSGDMLVGWVAYASEWIKARGDHPLRQNLRFDLRGLTDTYIKNCFTLNDKDGGLSDRASNGGLSFTHHGPPKGKKILGFTFPWGMALPITPPAALTTLSLLTLAGKELGLKYKLIKAVYSFVTFGWLWKMLPYLYTKNNLWYYTSHISAMALGVIYDNSSCGLEKLMVKQGMRWIGETARIGPNNVNPFIMGWVAPGLSKESKELSMQILSHIEMEWPQYVPRDNGFLSAKVNPKGLVSLKRLALIQLQKE